MKKEFKYCLGRVMEINGGMEYTSDFLFRTKDDPDEYLEKIARGWRGDPDAEYDKNMKGYWSDGTVHRNDGYRKMPREHFTVMSKYLPILD